MNAPSLAPLRMTLSTRIEICQQIIGYRFRNTGYIRQALTPLDSINQRLALVGDKVADAQLVGRWYVDKKRPRRSQWSSVRDSLLSNENLAEVGARLRIQDCTFPPCGPGLGIATTMEAIIGAVWLDSKRDFGAVNAVMERLSLTNHVLIRSPKTTFTTKQPRCEFQDIQSSRSLPDRFFVGHHVGLLQLLFKHSQPLRVQQRPGQHSDLSPLSPHKPTREAATMNVMSETGQKRTAAPVARKHRQSGRKPRPSFNTTNPPKRQAPEHVHASVEQANAEHDDSALESALPEQQPATLGDHGSSLAGRPDGFTGWHRKDTEWDRLRYFKWAVEQTRDQSPDDKKEMLHRLSLHQHVLSKLPRRSLRNMPHDFPADGVFLRTHCDDPESDRSYALQAALLQQPYNQMCQKLRRNPLDQQYKNRFFLLRNQLAEVLRARLELWLPPWFLNKARKKQIPPSLPTSGQPSATSSKTPESDAPATAAVDSTRVLTPKPCEHQSAHRPGSVLWTTHTTQHKSVDWKNYLSKPGSRNQEMT